ncbi:hypothetical protein [Peijinzhouia sedimentorum]
MKKYIFTFLVTTFAITLFAKSDNVDSLKNEINSLKIEIQELKNKQEYQDNQINNQTSMLDTAFDGVSTQLSASSIFIGIFGIIIALFSIALSVYVSRIEKNVKVMKTDNELLLQKNIQIKQELEELSEKITKDTSGLYKLIRNEESNHMIDRLISVPEDIDNLFSNLTSRDLEKEHFPKLKDAFMQLNDGDEGYDNYLTIFFQHFSDQSILDTDIKPKFMDSLDGNFESAFKNDIIKSVNDFFTAIIKVSISKSINDVNRYIEALIKSKFSSLEEVYFSINRVVDRRESKFELYDSMSKAPELLLFRQNFGKLILDYSYENLSPKEAAIIEEIKNIIA